MSLDHRKTLIAISYAALALLALVTIWHAEKHPFSSHPASRLAPAVCRVDAGTWSIDGSPFLWTHDKIFRDGHFYSDKPPAMDTLAASLYQGLRVAGLRFDERPTLVYRALVVTLSVAPFLAVVWLTWLIARREKAGWLAPVGVGVASLIWPYATTLSNHPLTAFVVIVGLFLARSERMTAARLVAIGALAGMVSWFDIPLGGIWPIALFAMVIARGGRAKFVGLFAAGLVAMWVVALAMNYMRHGSVLPPFFHSEWYQYEGSVWTGTSEGGRYASPLSRIYHLTFGHYGLFLMTPALLFAAAGAVVVALKRPDRIKATDALAILGAATLLVLAFVFNPSARGSDLGGGSYGFRWFIPMIAPLCLYLPTAWRLTRNIAWRTGMIIALIISFIVAATGVYVSTWPHNAISPYPFLENICALRLSRTKAPHPFVERVVEWTSADRSLSYHDLGLGYFKTGQHEAAVQALSRSLANGSDRIETQYVLAQALARLESLGPAAQHLSALLKSAPAHRGAINELAVIHYRLGATNDALKLFDQLLATDPSDISALNNSAMLLFELGRTDKALNRYDRSLAINPDGFEALYNKALLLEALNRRGEALPFAQQAVKANPEHSDAQKLQRRLQEPIL